MSKPYGDTAAGTIMFGWTTALVMAVIHRMAAERAATAP
jgi:hypothetical protein